MRFWLVEDLLVKIDRMSMAHSLEVRAPFLDHRLVELAASMPSSLKLRRGKSKWILRNVLRRYLPAETLHKPKQGFGVPLRDWFKEGLGEIVGDYLDGAGSRALAPYVTRAAVTRMLADHRSGEVDYRTEIWSLLTFAVWHAQYLRV